MNKEKLFGRVMVSNHPTESVLINSHRKVLINNNIKPKAESERDGAQKYLWVRGVVENDPKFIHPLLFLPSFVFIYCHIFIFLSSAYLSQLKGKGVWPLSADLIWLNESKRITWERGGLEIWETLIKLKEVWCNILSSLQLSAMTIQSELKSVPQAINWWFE